MLTNLYLQTTNPKLTIRQFFSSDIMIPVIGSAVFHVAVYSIALNVASYAFLGKPLEYVVNMRLFIVLILIMSVGYFARFLRVKDVYCAYNYDMQKTRAHLDKLYIGWIFIA